MTDNSERIPFSHPTAILKAGAIGLLIFLHGIMMPFLSLSLLFTFVNSFLTIMDQQSVIVLQHSTMKTQYNQALFKFLAGKKKYGIKFKLSLPLKLIIPQLSIRFQTLRSKVCR